MRSGDVLVTRPRTITNGVEGTEQEQQQTPPERRMKVIQHSSRVMVPEPLPRAIREQHNAVSQCHDSDEKPDRKQLASPCTLCHPRPPLRAKTCWPACLFVVQKYYPGRARNASLFLPENNV